MRTRKGVCILLTRQTENGPKGFVGKSSRGGWKLVQGGRKKEDRSFRQTALRELKEETGLGEEDLEFLEETGLKNRFRFGGDRETEPYIGIQRCFIAGMKDNRKIETNHEFREHSFLCEKEMVERVDHINLEKMVEKMWSEARKRHSF